MEGDIRKMKALEKITYGLYVLTTKKGEEKVGMIVSWVSQVSFNPPRIIVGVRKNRYAHNIIEESGVFALNVLGKGDIHLVSQLKASSPEEKFQGLKLRRGITGTSIIEETIAYMDCKLVKSIDAGDHTLFVGEIIDADILKDDTPLTSLDYGKVYLGQY